MNTISSKLKSPFVFINNLDELKNLINNRKTHIVPKKGATILINFKNLPPKTKKSLSEALNKNYYECGCRFGAAFFLIGIAAFIIYFVLFGFAQIGYSFLILIPISLIILSGIGKTLGIYIAKYKLKRLMNRCLKLKWG